MKSRVEHYIVVSGVPFHRILQALCVNWTDVSATYIIIPSPVQY